MKEDFDAVFVGTGAPKGKDLNIAGREECDKNIHIDIEQPTVRFNKFNDSSLDFSIWVYVRSYGAQFKMKSTMRLIMYEEFKKYDIRIPWPIRTVYQGDEKREEKEIAERETNRKQVVEEFGIGDLSRGEGD